MARPKSLGPYAPLSATYFDDDAVIAAGERAELLYVRGLAFSARANADGFITDRQASTIVGRGLQGVPRRIDDLVREDLWERTDGGIIVRSWLHWNKSSEELGRARKQDRERKANQRGLFAVGGDG